MRKSKNYEDEIRDTRNLDELITWSCTGKRGEDVGDEEAHPTYTCEVRRFLTTQTRGFLSERAVALRRINGCLLKQDSSHGERLPGTHKLPVLNTEARPICRNFRARTGPPCSLAAPKLLSLRGRLEGWFQSRCRLVRFTFDSLILLYYTQLRVGDTRKHRQVHNATACTSCERGTRGKEIRRRRGRGRMSPRFGRCFFTSEYLRVHGGLNNEPDGGGSSGALRSPLLWAGRV